MVYLEILKLIAEVITSVVTVIVMIFHLVHFTFKRCILLKIFFKGHTDITGKKIRFFKGLKLHHESNTNILKTISQKPETENVLVLDKEALLDIITNSGAFRTMGNTGATDTL